MSNARSISRRRGTAEEHETFVGANAEITVDTTNKRLVVHDGETEGGFPQATEEYVDDKASLFTDTETYQIPSDYATLQGAVDDLTRKRQDKAGVQIVLNIESGHEIESGISVANGDYGRFIITSTDAIAEVSDSFTGDLIFGENARLPVLDCKIDQKNLGGNSYYAHRGSVGYVTPGSGIINSGERSCYANRGSVIEARNTDFSGATRYGYRSRDGSIVDARGGVANDCGEANARVSHSGLLSLDETDLKDGVIGVQALWGGHANATNADLSGNSEFAASFTQGAVGTIDGAEIGEDGLIRIGRGATLNASGVRVDDSPSTITAFTIDKVIDEQTDEPIIGFNTPGKYGVVYNQNSEFTGGVVEVIENDKGTAIRFGNGLQICRSVVIEDLTPGLDAGDYSDRFTNDIEPVASFVGNYSVNINAQGYASNNNRVLVQAHHVISNIGGRIDGIKYFNTGEGVGGTTASGITIERVERTIQMVGNYK